MQLTQAQVKGRIKNIAKENNADARIILRIYMMERFLERVANSKYKDVFIIKGGILVTSMVGVSMRSTMDIDTSIRNFNLSESEILPLIKEICDIDLDDGATFTIEEVSSIMDEMEYPGIRFSMTGYIGEMVIPIKIDVSTGDIITPHAIEYNYSLLLENRSIKLWAYNLETILSEKLQTILSRGTLNTRMRDFYDIYTLMVSFKDRIEDNVLKQAFEATCKKRMTYDILAKGTQILESVAISENLNLLWLIYKRKFEYAAELDYENVILMIRELLERIMR